MVIAPCTLKYIVSKLCFPFLDTFLPTNLRLVRVAAIARVKICDGFCTCSGVNLAPEALSTPFFIVSNPFGRLIKCRLITFHRKPILIYVHAFLERLL